MCNNPVFEELLNVDVTPFLTPQTTNDNKDFQYLSWPYAWAEIKKRYPDARYTIWRDEKGLPYAYDPNTGYMVFVTLHAAGQEFPCFMPVLSNNNRPMKAKGYEYTHVVNGEKVTEYVRPANMNDISKTLMRCLVKACAFAGLGLFIYSGEDIATFNSNILNQKDKKEAPVMAEPVKAEVEEPAVVDELAKYRENTKQRINALNLEMEKVLANYDNKAFEELTQADLDDINVICGKYEKRKAKAASVQ